MINILAILELPNYYLSLLLGILECCYLLLKQADVQLDEVTRWLLGGWHFIAATAIKPPKTVACQFAADDILLYEFCYHYPMDLLHHQGRKEKEELSLLQISY